MKKANLICILFFILVNNSSAQELTLSGTVLNPSEKPEVISFENGKLALYAEKQSISVDIISVLGKQVKNIIQLERSNGVFELFPEAYISDLPKAIYIMSVWSLLMILS